MKKRFIEGKKTQLAAYKGLLKMYEKEKNKEMVKDTKKKIKDLEALIAKTK